MSIASNLEDLSKRLGHAQLLAVSKTFGADAVQAAFDAGQGAFGENYVQEAVDKIATLAHLKPHIAWHLIGPLQSNKTAVVAAHFDWVQTVDRLKIAQRLSDQRPADLPLLQICIQVNVDGGQTKSGIDCTDSTEAGLQALWHVAYGVACLPRLTLRGLLAIPEPQADQTAERAVFAKVRGVYEWLQGKLVADPRTAHVRLDTLSMGMSADYQSAIAEGATMVRIGSAIFGHRQ